jgi:hypothetical protein
LAVTKGEGTADEMMLIYFWYAAYKPGDENIVVDTSTLKNISSTVLLKKLDSKLSPNPIQNYLDFNSNEPITEINIFNLEGQKVANYQLDRIQKGRIDISNKPVGMYIIELKSPEKSSRTKMMIE